MYCALRAKLLGTDSLRLWKVHQIAAHQLLFDNEFNEQPLLSPATVRRELRNSVLAWLFWMKCHLRGTTIPYLRPGSKSSYRSAVSPGGPWKIRIHEIGLTARRPRLNGCLQSCNTWAACQVPSKISPLCQTGISNGQCSSACFREFQLETGYKTPRQPLTGTTALLPRFRFLTL